MIFERLPELKKCCSCLSLKVGCILIVIYYIVSAILKYVFTYKDILSDEEVTTTREDVVLRNEFVVETCQTFVHHDDCVQYAIANKGFIFFLVAIDVLTVISGLLFLFGIFKKKVLFATIFLYAIILNALIDTFLDLFYLFTGFSDTCKSTGTSKLMCVSSALIFLIVSFYFLIIVKSLRSVIRNTDALPGPPSK